MKKFLIPAFLVAFSVASVNASEAPKTTQNPPLVTGADKQNTGPADSGCIARLLNSIPGSTYISNKYAELEKYAGEHVVGTVVVTALVTIALVKAIDYSLSDNNDDENSTF